MDFKKFQQWCENKGFVVKMPSGYSKLINLEVSSFESFKGIFNLCMMFFYEELYKQREEETEINEKEILAEANKSNRNGRLFVVNPDNTCLITKSDLSLAMGLSSFAFKEFHVSNYQYGLALEKYVLEQRESKYPFVALPKKEIRENKGEKGEGALAKRTKDIMADYDIHVTANNNFKVDSTLGETENQEDLTTKEIRKKINSFDGQGLTFTQKTFVGGFIDQDKLPFNADYTQIYQENGR